MPHIKYYPWNVGLPTSAHCCQSKQSKQSSTLFKDTLCHSLLHVQVKHPPKCTLAGAEDLIEGCTAELQILSTTAASNMDLPQSLLLSGWLQRHCFMYASPASSTIEVMQNAFMVHTFAQSPVVSSRTLSVIHCCSKPLACQWKHQDMSEW